MMKINLGKIAYIVSILILPLILNAKVILQAPDTFYKNDVINFKIIVTGTDIKMPDIKSIDGNVVQSTGTSRHTTIINGARTYQFVQAYAMIGKKDIKMPSFDILVDKKVIKTKAKIIKMLKVQKTKSDLYDLKISVDKKDVYVGEAIEFVLKFRYKKDLDIVNLDYQKPSFENFWVKELKPQQSQNNYTQYTEQEIKYLLFPQKAGNIKLDPVKIGVTTMQNGYKGGFYLSSPTQTTPVYSNELHLNVKPLPNDTSLIGDFKIDATVDKSVVDEGDAISYKLYIEGRGNIDDLDEVNIEIANTTIYDNPSKKEYNLKNNIYGGKYSKIYSIVATENFTIPSIKIKYFDKKTASVKTIKTKAYKIKVNKKTIKENKLEVSTIEKDEVSNSIQKVEVIQTTDNEKIIFFFVGLLCGMMLIGIYFLYKLKVTKNEDIPLLSSAKKADTPNELFKLLLVYINIDEELDKIIYKLEKTSLSEYKTEKKTIIKKIKELITKGVKLDR